ncbi:MAG: hypothetical protein ACREIC_30615, partial [Limisphaerales bacterium]
LRTDLEKGWTSIVSVPEENVGIYAMSDAAGESNTGLAVLVYDGDSAVICNVVGHVSVGKLIKIATESGKLPKDFLKKLQGLGNQAPEPAATKSGDSAKVNAATDAPKPVAENGRWPGWLCPTSPGALEVPLFQRLRNTGPSWELAGPTV